MTLPADAPTIPPIRKQVRVALPVDRAFETFTADLGQWWPLATHSVGGEGSSVRFTGDQIVESTSDGSTCVWGTVQRWQPPHCVAFTWHPGADPEPHTDVSVEFVADGDECLVTLTHDGWERIQAGAEQLGSYVEGWDIVLAGYVAASARAHPAA